LLSRYIKPRSKQPRKKLVLLKGGPERDPAAVSEKSLVIEGLVTSERLTKDSKSEKGTSRHTGPVYKPSSKLR
jgi:hypothetical protein